MSALDRAIEVLRAGRAVVFPTDTVYGLGVAVEHASDPREIYELKRRDAGKPIAWLVGGASDLGHYGRDVSPDVIALAQRHWPGALTIVVNASEAVPPAFAPDGTIGLRMPANDTALELVRAVGPIAASSANRAGQHAPRSFAEVDPMLTREAAYVLRGDSPCNGIASTVVDATTSALAIIRQGPIRI